MEQETIAPPTSDVYYGDGYWNEYPSVIAEINRRITDDPNRTYVDAFVDRTRGRRFARALFLNCGNGWVERELYGRGLFDEAVGTDFSDDLLEQAREQSTGMPIRYVRADINEATFPDERFDLIVNYSAGHHIAYVDRVLRALSAALTDDGWFVNYDYVGPHRNQYPYEQWSAAWELNRRLPEEARQTLRYPHLPTMLLADPSEAIHSELFLETFRRYFSIAEFRPVGGALAYPLLTFNASMATLTDERRYDVLDMVMKADAKYLHENPHSTLFAYWCGTRNASILSDRAMLQRWTHEEVAREEAARLAGNIYYPRTLLQDLIYPEQA